MEFVRLPVAWTHLEIARLAPGELERIGLRLDAILDSWVGTPYMAGNAAKGVGVDCVRFVACVLDALYGQQAQPLDRLPADTALHSPAGAKMALRKFLRAYEPNDEVRDGTIQPGDVLVVAAPKAGPGHALIVSGRRNVLVHATRDGVQRTGIMVPLGTTARVFRIADKEKWLR